MNIYELKEQLGLIETDIKSQKILRYKYKDFFYFNKHLKKWVKEINDINDEWKNIINLEYKVITNSKGQSKNIIFNYVKTNKNVVLHDEIKNNNNTDKNINENFWKNI